MKEGQEVRLYHAEYSERAIKARVEEIEGNHKDFPYTKILCLVFTVDGTEYQLGGVSHLSQAEEGAPFYLVNDERAPKNWVDVEPGEDVEIPEALPVFVAEEESPDADTARKTKRRR